MPVARPHVAITSLVALICASTGAEAQGNTAPTYPNIACDVSTAPGQVEPRELLEMLCAATNAEAAEFRNGHQIVLVIEYLGSTSFRGHLEWQAEEGRHVGLTVAFGVTDRDLTVEDIPAIVSGVFAASDIDADAPNSR